ncbi:MAG: hypothetical protein MRY83_15385 [Flavobacteriales bacterium]|nr:hypothetical protein [Flavobacteriales bacterium]
MLRILILIFIIGLYSCERREQKGQSLEHSRDIPVLINQIIHDVHITSHEGLDDDWYENLPMFEKEKLVSDILRGIELGKINAYDGPIGMPTNDDEYLMSYAEVIGMISDTLVINTTDSATDSTTARFYIINTENTYQWIDRITFCERWFWDEKGFKMEKEVFGLALSRRVVNDFGDVLGYKRLFWVWFKDVDLKGIEV